MTDTSLRVGLAHLIELLSKDDGLMQTSGGAEYDRGLNAGLRTSREVCVGYLKKLLLRTRPAQAPEFGWRDGKWHQGRAGPPAAQPDLRALMEAARDAVREYRLHGQLTDSCRHLDAAVTKMDAALSQLRVPQGDRITLDDVTWLVGLVKQDLQSHHRRDDPFETCEHPVCVRWRRIEAAAAPVPDAGEQ